jgi:hypothetical protein
MIGYIGAVADLGPYNWPDYVDLSMEDAQKMAIDAYVRLKNHIAELPIKLHFGDRDTLEIMHNKIYGAFCKLYDLKEEFWDEFLKKMEGISKLQYNKIPAEVYDDILKWVETQKSIYLESDTPAN